MKIRTKKNQSVKCFVFSSTTKRYELKTLVIDIFMHTNNAEGRLGLPVYLIYMYKDKLENKH